MYHGTKSGLFLFLYNIKLWHPITVRYSGHKPLKSNIALED